MIGKINKKILLLAVVALLAISAACLLTNPVKQAKAEETTLTVTFIRGNDSLEIKKITGVRSGTEVKDLNISDIASTYDGAEIGYFANNLALPSQSLDAMKSLRYPITGNTTFYVYYKTSVNVFVYGNGMVMGRIIAAYDETLKNLDFSAVHYTEHGYDRIDFPTELGGLAEKHVYEMFGATISVGDPITITFTDGETNETLKIVRIPKNSAGTIGKSCGLTNADFVKSGKVFDKATLLPFNYDFKDISACSYPSDGSYTFKVYFKDAKHTVTFKNDSGVLKTATVNYGAKADTIDLTDINTAKTGYTFKGWSKTDGGAVVNLANETITADTTYYAVYEINKYSVLFYYGTSLLKTVTVPYGTKANEIDVSNLAPEREGYTFKGWARTNGGEVVDLSAITITQSMALFASYKKQTSEEPTPVTYTLTFKDGEKVLYTLSVESGKAVNLAEHPEINESAEKTGYTFKGWAITQDGAVIVKNGYIPNVTADTTFYAVYSEGIEPTEPTNPDNPDVPESTEYKVVFLVDNLVVYTATVKNGKAVSFADYPELSEKIKKDGYTFKGWKIEGQDEIYTDGIPVQNKTTVLVAVYEKKVLGIDGVSKAGSIVLTAAIGIVGVYFLFKLFGGKRRRR